MNRMAPSLRQSVSLPPRVAKRVRALAKTRKTSASRVLVDLIETGLKTKEAERARFLALARRFKESSDPVEADRLREELAHLIFGDVCGEGEFPKTFLLKGQPAKGQPL